MRNHAVDPQPPLLVRFVVGEVALEPLDEALAFEGEHVGGDAVEEEPVVVDDDGAAGEVDERLFERPQRVDVEVVGRLVEQQQVRAALARERVTGDDRAALDRADRLAWPVSQSQIVFDFIWSAI